MDAALAWLEGHKQGPFFAWIHLYDAHTPYEPPEPFLSKFSGRGLAGLYDGEIAFADQQVGRFVSWLRDERDRPEDRRSSSSATTEKGWAATARGPTGTSSTTTPRSVPFLVVTPFADLRGVRVDSQVSSVDLFPTVLGLCGIGDGPKVQGRSLLPVMFNPRSPVETYAYAESMTPSLQFGWGALHSLRSTRYKLIEAPRPELFDLVRGPGGGDERLRPQPRRREPDEGEARPAHGRDQPRMRRLRRLRTSTRRRSRGWPRSGTSARPVASRTSAGGVAGRSQGQAARLHGRPGGGRDDRERRPCRRRADTGVGAPRRPRRCPRPS